MKFKRLEPQTILHLLLLAFTCRVLGLECYQGLVVFMSFYDLELAISFTVPK